MNVLLIAVLIILIGCIVWGYWKGFIRIAFSLVTMVLTIALVAWVTPYISDFLKDKTNIYEDLVENCSKTIQLSAEKNADGNAEELKENNSIDGIPLPQIWVEQILEKAGNSVDQVMEENGIYRQVGEYIAEWILRGMAFFVAFILVSIVLKLVVGLLDVVAKLPLIKGANHLLGAAAGLVQGMLIVWLLLFLIAIACTSQLGQAALRSVNESAILTYLYQHNGILYFFNLVF